MKKEKAKQIWAAMLKFANDEPLTEQEWEALSWLTLINRDRLAFAPDNCRWATTVAERANNLAFSVYVTSHPPGSLCLLRRSSAILIPRLSTKPGAPRASAVLTRCEAAMLGCAC